MTVQTAEQETFWFISPDFPVLVRHWRDDFLVYHAGSGDSFVLDAFSGILLSLITEHAQTGAQLTTLMAQALESPADEVLAQEVLSQLSDLYGLGVIERVLS